MAATVAAPDYRAILDANLRTHPHTRAELTPASEFRPTPALRELTVDDFLAFGPCYGDERVRELAAEAGLQRANVLVVLKAFRGKLPDVDLIWLALRTGWYERPVFLRWVAADFAAMVLPHYESRYQNDDRPRRSIEAARQYALDLIDDATRQQARRAAAAAAAVADTAADAAYAAADSAAAAADTAAYAAAAVDAAAYAAAYAYAYAYAAVDAAADAVAYAATARSAQVDRLIALLEASPT